MPKVQLSKQFVIHEKVYGPGEVEVPAEVAKILTAGQKRHDEHWETVRKEEAEAEALMNGKNLNESPDGEATIPASEVQRMIDEALAGQNAAFEAKMNQILAAQKEGTTPPENKENKGDSTDENEGGNGTNPEDEEEKLRQEGRDAAAGKTTAPRLKVNL